MNQINQTAQGEYVPFVTDFPRPAAPTSAPPDAGGIDWASLAAQAGLGVAIAVLLAGAGLTLARRRRLKPRHVVTGVLALLALGAAGQALAVPAQPVPAEVAVPAGHKLYLTGHAVGVQIYQCAPAEAGYAWSFVAPRANLYTPVGKLLTTHFAGPTWQAKDGSFVVGRVAGRAPVADSIPWLKLEAASTGVGEDGGDRLAQTTYIQRLATTGGLAPAAGECNAATAGAVAEVPYTADYTFWKRKGS
jgi:hypothetical protein